MTDLVQVGTIVAFPDDQEEAVPGQSYINPISVLYQSYICVNQIRREECDHRDEMRQLLTMRQKDLRRETPFAQGRSDTFGLFFFSTFTVNYNK